MADPPLVNAFAHTTAADSRSGVAICLVNVLAAQRQTIEPRTKFREMEAGM